MLGTIGVGLIVFAVPHIAWPPLDRALGSRVVAIAAANAYALYLVHVPIKQTVDSFVVARGITPNTTAYGIAFSLGFCICCGIAVPLLHNVVELPFLTLKERARETFVVSTERINVQGTTRRLGS